MLQNPKKKQKENAPIKGIKEQGGNRGLSNNSNYTNMPQGKQYNQQSKSQRDRSGWKSNTNNKSSTQRNRDRIRNNNTNNKKNTPTNNNANKNNNYNENHNITTTSKPSNNTQNKEKFHKIKAVCRLRPSTDNDAKIPIYSFDDTKITVTKHRRKFDGGEEEVRRRFTLDRIYASDTEQTTIFEATSGMFESALNGERVCIFAYGQTGSG